MCPEVACTDQGVVRGHVFARPVARIGFGFGFGFGLWMSVNGLSIVS